MKKPAMYFDKNGPYEFCYKLDHFQGRISDGETEIKLDLAVPDIGGGTFWCMANGEAFESGCGECGKHCSYYAPRNGKSGICLEHRRCSVGSGEIFILTKNGLVKHSTQTKEDSNGK